MKASMFGLPVDKGWHQHNRGTKVGGPGSAHFRGQGAGIFGLVHLGCVLYPYIMYVYNYNVQYYRSHGNICTIVLGMCVMHK